MPLGFLQQGPLTSRLREGGKEPEKDAEIDAEAVSKGTGEPDETMPEPEEPAGTKPGLQESSGTKNGSPGGRQTQSTTDALLRIDKSVVGKSKSSVEMPKGFEELPPIDPQYQGIQGFSFGDFPPLGGEVSKDTTSNMTVGAKEAPSRDIGNVETLEKETELEGGVAPDSKGKAKEQTAAVESVPHIPAPVLPAETSAAPAQQISRPSPFRGPRFSTKDMAKGDISVKWRVMPTKGKRKTRMHDEPDGDWPEDLQAMYRSAGVQIYGVGGPVTQEIRRQVRAVFESGFCEGVSPEQGLVSFIFRGVFAKGLDLEFFMTVRSQGPTMYPSWLAIYLQDGMHWTPAEKGDWLARNQVVPTEAQAQSLANETELTADELEQFARGLVILVDWLEDLLVILPGNEAWTAEARRTHKNRLEYRLSILCYVAAMAESILAGTCLLDEQSTTEHRLLVEFYWILHKIPEYLVQTNCMDCCEGLNYMGERQASLQEL
jgi:hypothetical protein